MEILILNFCDTMLDTGHQVINLLFDAGWMKRENQGFLIYRAILNVQAGQGDDFMICMYRKLCKFSIDAVAG